MNRNKGFSLVELIIVIAIMAILAGALAPALIKYIAKSRRSTETIATAVANALSVEKAYDDATPGDYPVNTDGTQLGTSNAFTSEVTSQLGTSTFKPKYDKDKQFTITVNSDKATFTVKVDSSELYPDVCDAYK